ncbi:DUF7513 family protein [Halococcus saccharolyticus]|uniref:DUF7513 domain-containing protein n=1 Tax=Halococcus saccharolyticus DSM 5350 TaxID=1227455 RepID=M0MLL3_9EURY|nr:hypothetical protein [Halococcus saccharolyticus]EMA46278.1 hypothetical protein C449_04575 [Halococcus saccharolyticus DSM 5350]
MSRLSALFEGVQFRTNRPTFEPGEEIAAFVTGYENGNGVVRIGDTVLHLTDATPDLVDTQVRLRVEGFDDNDHVGRATVLDEIGDSSF